MGVSVGASVVLTSVGGTCKVGVGRGLHAANNKTSVKKDMINLGYFMVVSLPWKAIGILYWFFIFWLPPGSISGWVNYSQK
jgi:ABC-type dipeptide/oligopeptide/nickel transport system permease component